MWLGLMKQKQNLVPGIPKGYELCYELRNIERALTLPPISLHYTQKQVQHQYYYTLLYQSNILGYMQRI